MTSLPQEGLWNPETPLPDSGQAVPGGAEATSVHRVTCPLSLHPPPPPPVWLKEHRLNVPALRSPTTHSFLGPVTQMAAMGPAPPVWLGRSARVSALAARAHPDALPHPPLLGGPHGGLSSGPALWVFHSSSLVANGGQGVAFSSPQHLPLTARGGRGGAERHCLFSAWNLLSPFPGTLHGSR